jgi:hypothetical protein
MTMAQKSTEYLQSVVSLHVTAKFQSLCSIDEFQRQSLTIR